MKHKRIDAIFKRITTYGYENTDSTSSPLQRHDSNDPIVQLEKFVWLRICWEKHVVCKESSHSNLLAKSFICGWKEKEKLTCHFYKPGNSQEVHLSWGWNFLDLFKLPWRNLITEHPNCGQINMYVIKHITEHYTWKHILTLPMIKQQ